MSASYPGLETRGYNSTKSAFADCERGIAAIPTLHTNENEKDVILRPATA